MTYTFRNKLRGQPTFASSFPLTFDHTSAYTKKKNQRNMTECLASLHLWPSFVDRLTDPAEVARQKNHMVDPSTN